jgi:hypothetical protein
MLLCQSFSIKRCQQQHHDQQARLNERRQNQQKQIYDQNNRMNLPQLKCLEYESDTSSFIPKEELKRHKNKADST